MLKGKELGLAIGQAIALKIASGAVASKADIARHFGIKAPSVHDWIKRGSISKDKLPELWRYFSDVVGPEHWGLAEWPVGAGQAPELPIPSEIASVQLSLRRLAAAVAKASPGTRESVARLVAEYMRQPDEGPMSFS